MKYKDKGSSNTKFIIWYETEIYVKSTTIT
jgi:hypothetical protein